MLVRLSIVNKLHVLRLLVFTNRWLMRQDGADAIVGKLVVRDGIIDHRHTRCGAKGHCQQLMRGRQFGATYLASGVGTFNGQFRKHTFFGGHLLALYGTVTE